VFDGNMFVDSVEAPAFGFAGTNTTHEVQASDYPGNGRGAAPVRTGAPVPAMAG
jgi:hypothetical protein